MKKNFKNLWAVLIVLAALILVLITNIIPQRKSLVPGAKRPFEKYDYTLIMEPPVPLGQDAEGEALTNEILININEEREAVGLDDLSFSNGLMTAGQIRAKECDDRFSHTRPNGTQWYTVNETIMFGENLSMGYETADAIVNAWMNSPTHRDVIYDNEFQTCGIGVYKASDGTIYTAGEFGY